MHELRLRDFFAAHLPDMLAQLRFWVEQESPSLDEPALDRMRSVFQAELDRLCGDACEKTDDLSAFGVFDPAKTGRKPTLIVGHFDTVWPIGTLARLPFRVDGDCAYGPGIFDMKAGLLLVVWALRAFRALDLVPPRPVAVLITRDEETGSKRSRGTIERLARNAESALIVEPPLADGGLKTGRKGVGGYEIEVLGRAAHAGVEPEKGVNAIVELSHQLVMIQDLADPKTGTTINVGTIQGGTTPNVVPDRASARLDVRAATRDEAERVDNAIRRISALDPGATIEVTGGFNRPPMERTPAGLALFEKARGIARSLDIDLTEGATGGGSDGNFTAAVGTPTLDGLGVPGAGAHAEYEHIVVSTIVDRAAILSALILSL